MMTIRNRPIHQILRSLQNSSFFQNALLLPVTFLFSKAAEGISSLPVSKKVNSFQQNIITLRQKYHAATRLLMLFASFFVMVFILGVQCSLRKSNITIMDLARFSNLDKPSRLNAPQQHPVQRQLHEYHSVPKKYLNMMSRPQQYELLLLLSTPASNSTLALTNRKAVFTLVSNCQLSSCLRAVASAVTYAKVTGRVAVVFVTRIAGARITEILQLKPCGVLNDNAILISLDGNLPFFHESRVSIDVDWAEFSTVRAVVPSSSSLNISALSSPNTAGRPTANPKVYENDASDSYDEHLPKIANTKKPATLDNLAAVDSHVSISLNEVVWSSYSPRSLQEALFESEFKAAFGTSQRSITRSSLLGRRMVTRKMTLAEDRLRRIYKIPKMLLSGMTSINKKILLLKLDRKKSRRNSSPRAMFVHAQYGLGNRLRALGSAMAFARRTDRVLVLIWVADQHLNCQYSDLFVDNDEFVVSDSFNPGEDWPFTNNSAVDRNMESVKWYNFMRVNGKQVNSSTDPVTDDKKYHVYVSTCYVIQSPVTPFIIRTTSSFWHVLRSLTPQIDVLRLVEQLSSYPVSSMIGIHIRGKSIKTDITGVTATDYTEESSRTTDFWRNLTQVDTFIDEMRRQTKDQLFYVAADSKDVFGRLEREFPSRVFYTPRKCDSRDRECLPFALADILLLAKCSSLRGSYWSSFSELSTRIGGARFLLAGIDFGRPDRQLF